MAPTVDRWLAGARVVRAADGLFATHTETGSAASRSPDSIPARNLGEIGPVRCRLAALVAVTAETELSLRQVVASIAARDGPAWADLPDLDAAPRVATDTGAQDDGRA